MNLLREPEINQVINITTEDDIAAGRDYLQEFSKQTLHSINAAANRLVGTDAHIKAAFIAGAITLANVLIQSDIEFSIEAIISGFENGGEAQQF